MEKRIAALRVRLAQQEAQAFLVTNEANMRYFSGFTGEGALVIGEAALVLITDSRYTQQAQAQAPLYEVRQIDQRGVFAWAADALKGLGAKTCCVEGDQLTLAQFAALKKGAGDISFVETQGIGMEIRACKDAGELDLMRRAARYTDACLQFVYKTAKVGMTELDVCAELTYYMAKEYASEPAFAHIVASGENGSMPHAIPTERKLAPGDLVTLDFGASYAGYRSDMTRTFAMGKPNEKLAEVYRVVYEAQGLAQEALAPGKKGRDIDAIARGHIAQAGYGDYFGHGLGHGVGLDVHESPRLSPASSAVLEPGMVVTVEPGIYIPGLGGVRIENSCIITEDGYENLFTSPTDMIVL